MGRAVGDSFCGVVYRQEPIRSGQGSFVLMKLLKIGTLQDSEGGTCVDMKALHSLSRGHAVGMKAWDGKNRWIEW